MGKAIGSLPGGSGEVKIGNSVLNRFFGGEKSELALRGMIALSQADNTFDESKAAGANDGQAFCGIHLG